MNTLKPLSALLAGLTLCAVAHAQLKVEIYGPGTKQLPISIANFADEASAPAPVSAVVRADLERSGLFKIVDTAAVLTDTSAVNHDEWKAKGAEALAAGAVQKLADGRIDLRYRLLDTIKGSQISALAQTAQPRHARLAAHRIADDIYEKLTGTPGVFATRIAYVTQAGSQYRLEVADADGDNVLVALRSREPIISPSWSPDGGKVAYVSFEDRKPVVYVQNLVTGARSVVANHKGSNSAPSWSPDGSRLAVALSKDGHTQSYIVNADGSGLRRLTNSNGIDTEPRFSADGQTIYFTSDRSGGPQIYRMPVAGGEAQRITFGGAYNISPRLSPDGKLLAFISRRDGKFQLYVMDLASGEERRLSDGAKDESPSFSANSKYIMYATESGRRATLAVVSVDGLVKNRLTMQAGDVREPTWGPFMK